MLHACNMKTFVTKFSENEDLLLFFRLYGMLSIFEGEFPNETGEVKKI